MAYKSDYCLSPSSSCNEIYCRKLIPGFPALSSGRGKIIKLKWNLDTITDKFNLNIYK